MSESAPTSAWDFFEHFSPVLKLGNRKKISIPINHPGVTDEDIETIQTVVDRIPEKAFKVSGANKQGDNWLSVVIKRTK